MVKERSAIDRRQKHRNFIRQLLDLYFYGKKAGNNCTGVVPMAKLPKEKPDPQRVAVLRSLPLEVKEQISGEEAEAFMYKRDLPDSLMKKLEKYLVEVQA